jgi:formylglycine-generating enzyme required for sulfatase activity
MVSWFGAKAYCDWLTSKEGHAYRLPTEAEWEKAARGIDQRRYPWGDNHDGSYANYRYSGDPYDQGTTPVGYYDGSIHSDFQTKNGSSPYGAYDMAGNVWEWCLDWFGSSYYTTSPSSNPLGMTNGSLSVFRGGSWGDFSDQMRSTYRNYDLPYNGHENLGFRCVREDDGASGTPDIVLSDTSLVLSSQAIGASRSKSFIIFNEGDATLTVSSISSNNDPPFSVNPTSAFIAQNASLIVTVVFSPTVLGYQNARIMIISNDSDEETLTLNVFSNGIDGQTVVNDGYGDYLIVPAGSFEMGDNFNEGESWDADELPVHNVYLDAYYIGKHEVTNAQYSVFLNDVGKHSYGGYTWLDISSGRIDFVSGNYIPESGFEDYPVIEVSWYGSVAYCDWLTTMTGHTYRLPTEAQWEKAARGDASKNSVLGHQRRYPWGDNIDGSYANYVLSWPPEKDKKGITPVGYYDGSLRGSFQTNDGSSPYGAYDMAGNVFEWCSDMYSSSYYSDSPVTNPLGAITGCPVLRGGGYIHRASSLRSAQRFHHFHGATEFDIGFRCVRELTTGTNADDQRPAVTPHTYKLRQNYPNPFNPETTISFDLPKTSVVSLIIYDVLGREIKTLVSEQKSAGLYDYIWDGNNDAGNQVKSGVYIYRIQTGDFTFSRKMILIR